jgi:hypothetical protein
MQFSERVLTATMGSAPEGWLDKLTLEQYAELDEERKPYYEPLFGRYRTKKIRDYDPDYGNFVGWRPVQVGVGDPIAYKYVGYFAAKTIDAALKSNVLASRILANKTRKGGVR